MVETSLMLDQISNWWNSLSPLEMFLVIWVAFITLAIAATQGEVSNLKKKVFSLQLKVGDFDKD